MKLTKKRKIEKPKKVYNLHVEKNHNYFANNMLVSNCHGSKAEVMAKLLCGPFKNVPIRWGLTGTLPPEELHRVGILSCLGHEVYGASAVELQERGILSNLEIEIVQINETMKFREYAEEQNYLLKDKERLGWFGDYIKEQAKGGNVLVLVNRVETGNILTELIEDSVFINGSVKSDARKEEYDKVKTEDNKIIIATNGVASTGINLPRIFTLILFEPGKSFIRTIQSIGRGLRKAEDKDFVNVKDICSRTKYSLRHLTQRKKFYKQAQYPFKITKIDIRGDN